MLYLSHLAVVLYGFHVDSEHNGIYKSLQNGSISTPQLWSKDETFFVSHKFFLVDVRNLALERSLKLGFLALEKNKVPNMYSEPTVDGKKSL